MTDLLSSARADRQAGADEARRSPILEVRGVSKSYGSGDHQVHAIDHLDFQIAEQEFVCIVGPSGCGKTTLLKCMSGLLEPSAGSTVFRGQTVHTPPKEMAIVFQDYSRSLFPWMTVRKNVALPLRKRRDVSDKDRIVNGALDAVGLSKFVEHYPWQLSGGMQQRVAIARALAYQPKLLLMDEPFASVDAQTRADLEDLVLRVRREFGITVVLVTHDIDESVYMADRVIVLSKPPSTVQQEVTVTLPTPRDQVETKADAEFARLRTLIYLAIKQDRTPSAPDASDGAGVSPAEHLTSERERL
jgi:NitT/TauT family transport system ATP-binding protein